MEVCQVEGCLSYSAVCFVGAHRPWYPKSIENRSTHLAVIATYSANCLYSSQFNLTAVSIDLLRTKIEINIHVSAHQKTKRKC